MPRSFFLIICICLHAALFSAAVAQEALSPAIASSSGGTVVIRQSMLPHIPMPGTERIGTPQVEPAEFRLTFHVADVQAYQIDSKLLEAGTWQQRIGQETPILFGGHAIVGQDAPAAQRTELNLPAELRQMYRADALVLFGNRSPIKQEPVRNAKLPAGAMPRFGVASLLDGGWLRVVERQQVRSHYEARFGHGTGNVPHVYQTTTTVTTRDVQADRARVWDVSGKALATDALRPRLAKEQTVMIAADGNPVDPFFLSLLRPDSLVVAVPGPRPLPHTAPVRAPGVAPAPGPGPQRVQ